MKLRVLLWLAVGLLCLACKSNVNGSGEDKKEAAVAEQRKQIEAEIADLKQKQRDDELVLAELAKIEVSGASFFLGRMGSFGSVDQFIEMTVKNGTDKSIATLWFTAVLKNPEREVPWGKTETLHSISGGLAPGEQQIRIVYLPSNAISLPHQSTVPDGAELLIRVTRIDGADGQSIFGELQFGSSDKARLGELKAELEKL